MTVSRKRMRVMESLNGLYLYQSGDNGLESNSEFYGPDRKTRIGALRAAREDLRKLLEMTEQMIEEEVAK